MKSKTTFTRICSLSVIRISLFVYKKFSLVYQWETLLDPQRQFWIHFIFIFYQLIFSWFRLNLSQQMRIFLDKSSKVFLASNKLKQLQILHKNKLPLGLKISLSFYLQQGWNGAGELQQIPYKIWWNWMPSNPDKFQIHSIASGFHPYCICRNPSPHAQFFVELNFIVLLLFYLASNCSNN